MDSKIKEDQLILKDDNGNEFQYEIIATVASKENNKNYVVFTDNSLDEDGCIITFASIYDPTGEDKKLYPIETEEEWDFVEKLLANLDNESIEE